MAGVPHDLVERLRRAFGLSGYEARVYIALLLGARNPKEASASSGVPLPRVYDVVRLLESKGLVEREPGGWYVPVPPRAAAAAVLARVEEEARRRARLALEVVEELEEAASTGGSPALALSEGSAGAASAVASVLEGASTAYATFYLWPEGVARVLSAALRAAGLGELRILHKPGGHVDLPLPEGSYRACELDAPLVDSVASRERAVYLYWYPHPGGSTAAVSVGGWHARVYFESLDSAWRRACGGATGTPGT